MCDSWKEAYKKYSWTVPLGHFDKSADYPNFFNHIIRPTDVITFEDKFRTAIDNSGSFEIAGEVCFWKNYGNIQARNRVTLKLLTYLKDSSNWDEFIQAIKQVSKNPSYDNFIILRDTCNQPRGFATPITFLSFYKPIECPMVDKHIAYWWATNRIRFGYDDHSEFSQRDDGWIQTNTISQIKQNWDAYIAWKTFCNDYTTRISNNCRLNWRARDVEMAVWEAQKNNIHLEVLT